jgi:hypothetical protein
MINVFGAPIPREDVADLAAIWRKAGRDMVRRAGQRGRGGPLRPRPH